MSAFSIYKSHTKMPMQIVGDAIWYRHTSEYNDIEWTKLMDSKANTYTKIRYMGANNGQCDKYIQIDALFFGRKNKEDSFIFFGTVTNIKIIHERTKNKPAEYEITINHNHLNNVQFKQILHKLDEFKPYKYNIKASALSYFNLKHMAGSYQSGATQIQSI